MEIEQKAPGQNPAETPAPAQEPSGGETVGGKTIPEGMQEEIKSLINEAKGLLYGGGYESMIKLFQKNGKKGFSDACGVVVVGVLDKLEEQNGGKLDPMVILLVGISIVAMLASDLSRGGVVPDLDADDVQLGIGMVMAKWMESHKDRAGMEKAAALLQKEAQARQGAGQGGVQGDLATQTSQTGVMGAV